MRSAAAGHALQQQSLPPRGCRDGSGLGRTLIAPILQPKQLAGLLLLALLLAATTSAAAAAAAPSPPLAAAASNSRAGAPPCASYAPDGVLQVPASCSWRAPLPAAERVAVLGARPAPGAYNSVSATPFVFAPAEAAAADAAAAGSTGAVLTLERLVLNGFQLAAPGGAQPLFWPEGLVAGSGAALNLTDVRFVVRSQEVFAKYLDHFTSTKATLWTDNANVLHVHQWSDGRTRLRAVGLLLAPQGSAGGAPQVKNCLLAATNASLLAALQPLASVATPLPLLVYVTSNVTVGAHPPLPPSGVVVRRPLVLVGLDSTATSLDFEMVVNQLNLSTSEHANVTFVGLVLNNLAPGDSTSSAMATPFSIAVTNNVWAVYFNRSVPNEVRWVLHNTTLVLSQESEMSYVIYMFTLFTSPLPYLKQQTAFYTDVLHMSMLQFAPGPGSHAITVSHLKSWFHLWADTVLTAQPLVAEPLPLPVRPLVLTSATRASPLVQAVRTPAELKTYAESPVIGDREHILLFLSNVTMPAAAGRRDGASQAITLPAPMTWVGYSSSASTLPAAVLPARGRRRLLQQQKQRALPAAGNGLASEEPSATPVSLGLGFNRPAVVLPPAADWDVLTLQQLVLGQLPQGPGAAGAVKDASKGLPHALATIMLWAFDRPLASGSSSARAVRMDGVVLQLPAPELDYYSSYAAAANDFVIEVSGSTGARTSLAFEDAFESPDGAHLHVASLTGPGIAGTNVTLSRDAGAAAAMPGGYFWPEPGALRQPSSGGGRGAGQPAWVMAVVAVCVTLGVLLLGVAGFVWWQRRRLCLRDPEAGRLGADDLEGSRTFSKHGSRSSYRAGGDHNGGSHMGDGGRGSSTTSGACAACAGSADGAGLLHTPHGSACGTCTPASKRGSPITAGRHKSPCDAGDAAAQRDATGGDSSTSLADNVAAGMQRWRAAVSTTTMLLMERRMDAAAGLGSSNSGSLAVAGTARTPSAPWMRAGPDARQSGNKDANNQHQQQQQQQLQPGSQPNEGLVLQELLGQGSFGSVFMATWRGKRVAVKVMQLPASALLEPGEQLGSEQQQQQQDDTEDAQERRRRQRQQQHRRRQNSPPHMAIMEAVVSSTLSHPNVVQVYTYMLSPLTSSSTTPESAGPNTGGGGSSGQDIAGWSLKLVMELCDEGSLREALDCGLLAKPGGYLAPSAVLTLAHDVAAAMLHLHSEGIVHGDLKAGNVMLTSSGSSNTGGLNNPCVWAASGDRPLTAKVADFGLSLSLGPTDTHATLLARGTPTHMSPELFTAGRVSKASDVYAYGVLLYEVMTGRRAYAGVPIPLLPHEVAVQGLRPEWPAGLPPGCRDLRRLAEACWAHDPQQRPTFADILHTLDAWAAGGHGWPPVAPASRPMHLVHLPAPQQQQQPQQQQHGAAQDAAAPHQQAAGGQAQNAALLLVGSTQPVDPSQQQQPQQRAPSLQQPGQPQQPQQQARAAPGAADAPAGRNLHISWSEVDVNDGGAGGAS